MLVFNGQPGIEGECEIYGLSPGWTVLALIRPGTHVARLELPPAFPTWRMGGFDIGATWQSFAMLAQVTITLQTNNWVILRKGQSS